MSPSELPPESGEAGHYVTLDEIREEAEASEATMPNATANKLRRLAEAIVENALGERGRATSGPQEGLKVTEESVEPWQWTRLRETILVLCVRFFENPDFIRGIVWDSVSGPDFSRSGGQGKVFGNEAALLFAGSGLMPRAARARP